MSSNPRRRRLRPFAVGAMLIAGSLALGACGSDDEPATASADEATTDVVTADTPDLPDAMPEGDACILAVDDVAFALDPAVIQGFASQGLNFTTLAPAKTVTLGQRITPRIQSKSGVTCDLSGGFIGMRGGFRVSSERGKVEFRRFRMRIDDREMFAFLRSTGNAGLEAIGLDIAEAQFTEQGALLSAEFPMVLDSGAAVAMNAALGTDFPADELELGTVTISGVTDRTPSADSE